jgi:multidrug resistance efflux pump
MAAVLVLVSLRALTSEQGYIGTNNAVLSSQLTILRAPIEGYVAAQDLPAGKSVESSSVVETIRNTRPEGTAVADLKSDLNHLVKQHEAAVLQRQALSGLLTELANRAMVDTVARISRFSANIEMYREKKASAETRRDKIKRDYDRKLALLNLGNATIADVDHLRSDFIGATQDAAAALAAMQVEISARDAAQNGVLVEPGSNDVSYSVQRADEIRILLMEVDRSIADLDSAAKQTREKLDHKPREQIDAPIIAPISGMIWKLGALNDERVSPGDVVMELVDCRHAFIMASIPQYRIPQISLGMKAQFKFAGETFERLAQVVSVESGGMTDRVDRFAALPLPEREPSAIVILSPSWTSNTRSECLIGRTARVLLPITDGDFVHTLVRGARLDLIWNWVVW